MKLGSRKGLYYVGWYCDLQKKVVYAWFPNLDAAYKFLDRNR